MNFLTIGFRFLSIIIFILLQNSYINANNVYYASPQGGGDGMSAVHPFFIKDFCSNIAKAGDTLILLDGKYSGDSSMIKPLMSGLGENQRITIRAMHDGMVDIDGQDSLQPVNFQHKNCYFTLEGFNAHNSGVRDVISISDSCNYNIIRRVCAWDGPNANSGIFGVHGSLHTLFEDCAGWGVARKIFHNSQGGNYTTYRRCWGRWEHLTGNTGPYMTYSLFYNSYHNLMENCIGTWDTRDTTPATETYGIFGTDREDSSKNAYCSWLGCIAYVTADQNCKNFTDGHGNGGLFFFDSYSTSRHNCVVLKNCFAFADPIVHKNLRTFHLMQGDSGLVAQNLTSVGGAGITIASPWVTSNILQSTEDSSTLAKVTNILNPPSNNVSKGAIIMKCYQDGKLTDKDLWPWPMNQRIIDAMIQSGRKPVDVTKTISDICGIQLNTVIKKSETHQKKSINFSYEGGAYLSIGVLEKKYSKAFHGIYFNLKGQQIVPSKSNDIQNVKINKLQSTYNTSLQK